MLKKLLGQDFRRVSALSTKFGEKAALLILGRSFSDQKSGTTIYALSSGYGKCGVAVIRISGPDASLALEKMTKIHKLESRKAFLRRIRDPETKEVLDKGLCLWFPGPFSFTGEDSVEFHIHGGPALIKSLLNALSKMRFVPAGPGEFTRRAFFNGKMDLTEAEGIADLIDAETEKQRKQATNQTHGNLRKLYHSLRSILLECHAALEALIEFSEENEMQTQMVLRQTQEQLQKLQSEIRKHLSDGRKGEILRSGAKLVLLGRPNVGKSSLANVLIGRESSIVSAIPGTTRDVVETTIDISGYPVVLKDTAGIRSEPQDQVEILGIGRAKDSANNADLILRVLEVSEVSEGKKSLEEFGICIDGHKVIDVVNKVDLVESGEKERLKSCGFLGISCTNGEGIEDLVERMAVVLEKICGDPSEENPVISNERYRNHLTRCLEHIEKYLAMSKMENHDAAISMEEIRAASREIGKITGEIASEEIFDVIFKKFCIGK